MVTGTAAQRLVVLLHSDGGIVPEGTRVEVFNQIYWVFLVLGTLVGIVVIGYMLWKAYKYRHGNGHEYDDVARPELGELPTGGGGGRKLFVSFGLSAVIVVSLIAWTYGTLLFVENKPVVEEEGGDHLEVEVVGSQFAWTYVYPNGYETDTLRVPEDTEVRLVVTSADVFHNYGIPAFRVKSDAIPGQTTETWFIAEETGTYVARCYELCGAGHSHMTGEVIVMEQAEFEEWYEGTGNESSGGNESSAENGSESDGGHGDDGDSHSHAVSAAGSAPAVGVAPEGVSA